VTVELKSASHDQASRVSPTVDDLNPINAPLDIGGEQQVPIHQRRHDLKPQDEDANPVDFTTCTDPQEVITVDAEMTAFDDRPTRQTARTLHANTQGEESTRQEMVTDLGSTDGLDNEDAVPADGANNPQDEDPKTDDPGQTPSRNKKIRYKKIKII